MKIHQCYDRPSMWSKFIILMKIDGCDENKLLWWTLIIWWKFIIFMKINHFDEIPHCDETNNFNESYHYDENSHSGWEFLILMKINDFCKKKISILMKNIIIVVKIHGWDENY